MAKVTDSIEINASPEKVFDFITSNKMNDVQKDISEGTWTSKGPVGLGSTMHIVGTSQKYTDEEKWKRQEWNAEVTEFTKNKSMTLLIKGANSHSSNQTNIYVLEPTPKGAKLELTIEFEDHSRFVGKFPAKTMDRLLTEHIKSEVAKTLIKLVNNIKKALEA